MDKTPPGRTCPAGSSRTVARNVATRYLAIAAEMVLGLVMLPFNLAHLGPAEYGLWVLLGSITMHFSTLELGYGSGLVKFVAQYRAQRDPRALNEIASTLFFVFSALALVAYVVVIGVAFNLDHLFKITPQQAQTGKWVLLIIGIYVALNFPFGVYGGIISGFQRYDINNTQAVITSVVVALVNVAVLHGRLRADHAGRGDDERAGARVFHLPAQRLPGVSRRCASGRRCSAAAGCARSPASASTRRSSTGRTSSTTRSIRSSSACSSAAPSVAVWAPAERIISGVQRLTNQLNGVLFPTIVDSDASRAAAAAAADPAARARACRWRWWCRSPRR